jgi:cytochrome c oxidase subunit 4
MLTPRNYSIICIILVIFTFLTLSVSFAPLHGAWHIGIGLVIGLCKASLVILFFMHALVSPRVTWLVIAVSGFWLGILIVLTLSDYVTRDMVPYLPGH